MKLRDRMSGRASRADSFEIRDRHRRWWSPETITNANIPVVDVVTLAP